MRCRSCNPTPNFTGFVPCPETAVIVLWCPTWVNASEGILPLCEHHAENFMPEHNEHVSEETPFYWGEEAQRAYDLWTMMPSDERRSLRNKTGRVPFPHSPRPR